MVSAESQQAMDAARQAVKEFMSKNGHNDTSVYELVRPAIYHETISRNEREEVVTVIDRESHIDHYHTSIQPITDSETLEEQHESHVLPVETRTMEHEDYKDLQNRLEEEAAKFRDTTLRIDGERTHDVVPVSTSEHIHHHVHEVIQPVVKKHTVEPHIIHTISFIHERHHQAAQHHSTSALPAVTMAEFKKQGGVLTGREERFDWFEGEPRSIGGVVGNAKNPNGSPVETSTKAGSGQGVQGSSGARTDNKEQSNAPQAAQITTSPAPQIQAPERRSSLPPTSAERPQQASSQQPPAPDTNTTSKPTEPTNPSTAPTAHPSAAAAPAGGRWSLLPMHFARSDADASRASHPANPPRATAHPSVMQNVQSKAEQQRQSSVAQGSSSVARPTGQSGQAGQSGQSGQTPARYPADSK